MLESQPHLLDHGDASLQFAAGRQNRATLFQDGREQHARERVADLGKPRSNGHLLAHG